MLQIIPLIYFITPLFAQDWCDSEDGELEQCGGNAFVGGLNPGNVQPVDPDTVGLASSYMCFQTQLFLTNNGCKLADLVHCGEFGVSDGCDHSLINITDFFTFYNGETYSFGGTASGTPLLDGSDGFGVWQLTFSLWATDNNLISTSNEGITGLRGTTGYANINTDGTASFAEYMYLQFEGECDDDNGDDDDDSSDSSDGLVGLFSALMDGNNMDKDNIDNNERSYNLVFDVSTKTMVEVWVFIGIVVGIFIFGICLFYYKKQAKY